MAQQGVQLDQEQLCCSICLDLLKDPVTVPCGHSYCRRCIERFWKQDDQRGRFSCPQCRHTFKRRPVLKKNTMLAEVVESLKKTGLHAAPPEHFYAGPGDVACDVCTGRRMKAVKTCLQCLVSYCDTHLQPHYLSPAFKKHKLVKASGELQENICSRHDEVKKLFCRTDQQCICSLCSVEEHKGHDTISAKAERTERQKELHTSQQNIQQRIQEREKVVKVLHDEVESINHCADRAVENSDTIFTELISSMERRRSEVRELIRDQQKCEVSRAEEQRRRVEQEITELRRRHAELKQLSLTEDHIHFLQRYTSSLSKISESTHPVSSNACPLRYFEHVTVAMSRMREKLEDILRAEGTNVSETVNRVDVLLSTPTEPKTRAEKLEHILTEEGTNVSKAVTGVDVLLSTGPEPKTIADELEDIYTAEGTNVSETVNREDVLPSTPPEPKTRAEFLQYSRPITLDPNTANQRLSLSKGNRKVTVMDKPQLHPDHPERFTGVWQVLSREALTGRCYWEVELSGYCARIAVSHEDISRTGDGECGFGSNDKSWSLGCTKQGYIFIHRGIKTDIPGRVSSKVGVYLDHSAGTLSFYSVSDTMTLLHTVHTTFTQNLHAGLWLYSSPGDTAELCDLEPLSLTEDPVHFLACCSSLESTHPVSSIDLRYVEDETVAESNLTDKLEDSLTEEWTNVSETVSRVDVSLSTPQEPNTSSDVLLDYLTEHGYSWTTMSLTLTEDPVHFLACCSSLESTHPVSSIDLRYVEDETVAESNLTDKLEDSLTEEWTNVSETVNRVDVSLSTPQEPKTRADKLEDILTEEGANVSETVSRVTKLKKLFLGVVAPLKKKIHMGQAQAVQAVLSTAPEPKTRAEFLQYSRPITLDPNTANEYLSLSKGNRKVTFMNQPQSYPDHPERFTGSYQVLSREGVTGRWYWEVEWSGVIVHIAVSYKDINRTNPAAYSDGCGFGFTTTSWALRCRSTKEIGSFSDMYDAGSGISHGGRLTGIPGPVSSRVGVYLDHSAGTLSFYSVSDDTMTLLHTVHTTFTHNLHAGLYLHTPGVTAELCE